MTMLQGFVGVDNLIGVFWSLKFEMSFYALMTLLAYQGWMKRPVRVYLIWLRPGMFVSTSRRPFIFFWTSRYDARHAICFRDFSLPGNGLQDRVTG